MNNNRGFGLLEVVFAISIFSMGLLAAVGLHYSTAKNNSSANVLTEANMAAKAKLENLRSTDVDNLVEGVYNEDIGGVKVSYTLTRIKSTLMRAVVSAETRGVRKRTVRFETYLNNYNDRTIKATF